MIPKNPNEAAALTALHRADLYRIQVRDMRNYAMFTLDPSGIVTSWNAGVEALLGYSEEEWLGQHASCIFTPEEKAVEVCESEMQLASQTGSSTDIRWHRHKDGSQFFANGFMNALRDEQGTLIGFAKIMSDETARKQLQDSLTESNSALEQFAWVASHDLQEPLRTMRTNAQLLSRRYMGQFDEDANRSLGFIIDASSRMSALVQDLLAYAQLAGDVKEPTSVALDEDLEAALTHLEEAIRESGASITHDPLPTLEVGRGQMVRLFQNLIGNAVKYRKPDQPVNVHVSAEQSDSEWVFSVRDNGIGFDPQFAASIFLPFNRLHATAEYPGTGVGLAICRRIVQSLGGRIWAEAIPGQGATIFFTLPLDPAGTKKHSPHSQSSRS